MVVIPIFLMFRDLNLLDTLQGLILVYSAFNLPFTIWMMKGFIDDVPAEYEEAAMLDGYSRFEAFWRVSGSVIRKIENTNSFQEKISANTAVAAMPGIKSGIVTRQNASKRE